MFRRRGFKTVDKEMFSIHSRPSITLFIINQIKNGCPDEATLLGSRGLLHQKNFFASEECVRHRKTLSNPTRLQNAKRSTWQLNTNHRPVMVVP
jgi:UTP-glucose-1-phosphate uridylyltransferase